MRRGQAWLAARTSMRDGATRVASPDGALHAGDTGGCRPRRNVDPAPGARDKTVQGAGRRVQAFFGRSAAQARAFTTAASKVADRVSLTVCPGPSVRSTQSPSCPSMANALSYTRMPGCFSETAVPIMSHPPWTAPTKPCRLNSSRASANVEITAVPCVFALPRQSAVTDRFAPTLRP